MLRNKKSKIMDNIAIQKKIDKNRELIDRFLNSDCSLNVLYGCIEQLEKNNDRLIKQLNE